MSDYDAHTDHPLRGVPLSVLNAARKVLREAAEVGDVHPGHADPIADAVVMSLLQDGGVAAPTELSAALDEVHRLRQALAYEAARTREDLRFATFPKSRRAMAEDAMERMTAAARGDSASAYSEIRPWALRVAMEDAEASATLTRAEFAAERKDR